MKNRHINRFEKKNRFLPLRWKLQHSYYKIKLIELSTIYVSHYTSWVMSVTRLLKFCIYQIDFFQFRILRWFEGSLCVPNFTHTMYPFFGTIIFDICFIGHHPKLGQTEFSLRLLKWVNILDWSTLDVLNKLRVLEVIRL